MLTLLLYIGWEFVPCCDSAREEAVFICICVGPHVHVMLWASLFLQSEVCGDVLVPAGKFIAVVRVPVRVSHVAIGESSKELAKPNLWILAILAKSINIWFS